MFLVLNTVNIMFIALLTLLSALSISGVAAYYSIIGLATIFPGAFIPVVLMGSVLEVGKLVCASWLYRNWTSTNLLLRSYLFFAVIVLSLVTSMGIFGFLSKAHLQNEFADGSVTQKIEIINSQIRTEEGIIARQNEIIKRASGAGTTNTIRIEQLNQRLLQLDREVEAYTSQGSSFLGGDKVKQGIELKKSQQAERDKINAEINRLANTSSTSTAAAESQIAKSQQKIVGLIQQRDPLMSERLKLEAEIGPIKYIAALAVDFGWSEKVNANSAVRWVIIILIFVFDPLAVLMLVAANQSLVRRFPIPVDPPAEILDLERPDLDTPVIPTGVVKQDPKVDQWNEVMLKTKAELAREEAEKKLKDLQTKLDVFNEKLAKEEDKDTVSYTLDNMFSVEEPQVEIKEAVKVEPKEEPQTEDQKKSLEKEIVAVNPSRAILNQVLVKKKTPIKPVTPTVSENTRTELTEVIEPEKAVKDVKPILETIEEPNIKLPLPKNDFERRGMLNKFHQQYGRYEDISDVELKQERDNFNRERFLTEVPITEEDARNHPPITKSRMSFFQDYLDDILRGDTRAENLPPEIAKTCAILLSDYDNPAVVEPRPAGQPDIAVMTTEQLKETWQPETKVEDRDITDEELDKLIASFEEDNNPDLKEFDIVIKDGKKIRVPKKGYIQNEEQTEDTQWKKILDIPEPEKNEILLPSIETIKEEDVPVSVTADAKLPKEKLNKHKSRVLSDVEYRQKIEQRINDLITKIEQGNIKLEDLPTADQQTILNILNNNE